MPTTLADFQKVEQYLTDHQNDFIETLKTFLRIESVSADSKFIPEIKRGAEFVEKQLTSAGLETKIYETAGHPIVYGSWLKAEGAPTVMVYGHYDVQPADPYDLWKTPPFDPDIREGHIYARGATDDKGQMMTHVNSVASWLKVVGSLPVNVKFVIEGEEEVGSDNLDKFLSEHQEMLQCDVAVVSDTSQFAPGVPAITYALRGITACELKLTGPGQDLHSGLFGGSVANPANIIARLVASLHNAEGQVQIPGFYDDVLPLSEQERNGFANLPFDEPALFKALGVSEGYGEAGFTTLERRWARPTCDVNGIWSGYQGEGPKTIVPSIAGVKISCRLVPNQDPEKINSSLESFLRELCPASVDFQYKQYHSCGGLVFDTDSGWMKSAGIAIEHAFGVSPVFIREGGSIPVVSTFKEILGVDTLLLGWGQSTDNLHSPNERFSLEGYRQGTLASARLWQELANL
ncbi:Succinyl-diaminopimelate desuccinylase [Polystyrenella longa]|uniref:Succinyl-diaminopimelate desuccinylase n=1 Tax=Polystyrenella longa TaxID=2528007 RepID=A0A518CQ36_9PLAN|nr:dipeptidase [Polystyrenella longa]QDU81336.1 Succinyl-diaminopimelate desuccinylase [Polystyrenella longa]